MDQFLYVVLFGLAVIALCYFSVFHIPSEIKRRRPPYASKLMGRDEQSE